MRIIAILIVLGMICAAAIAEPPAIEPESLHHRLTVEAPAAQKQLRTKLVDGLSFDGRYELVTNSTADKRPDFWQHGHYVFSYPAKASEIIAEQVARRGRVGSAECINDRYAFEIEKPAVNASWLVRNLATNDGKAFLLRGTYKGLQDLSLEELFLHSYLPILDIQGIPVDRFFTSPGVSIQAVERDAGGRVVVAFTGEVQTPTGFDRVLDGKIWLSPKRSWAVDEYDCGLLSFSNEAGKKVERKGTVHRKVEWTKVDELPVPSSLTTTYVGGSISLVEIHEKFSNWERKRYPADRFLLSYYDLPEPGLSTAGSTSSRRSLLLWVNVVVGIVLIGFALAIRFRSARASKEQ